MRILLLIVAGAIFAVAVGLLVGACWIGVTSTMDSVNRGSLVWAMLAGAVGCGFVGLIVAVLADDE